MDEQKIRKKYNTKKVQVESARAEFTIARADYLKMDMCKAISRALQATGPMRHNESDLDWGNRFSIALKKMGYRISRSSPWRE